MLLLLLCTCSACVCRGQLVSVSLLDTCSLDRLEIAPTRGEYSVLVNGVSRRVSVGERLRVVRAGDSLFLRVGAELLGLCRNAVLLGDEGRSQFALEVESPLELSRTYDGNLGLSVDYGRIMCVNLVDMDVYLAGVIQAEMGYRAPLEAYKAQALLARTYLLAHLERHMAEGYNVCDQVHCQAYRGSAGANEVAMRAARETSGQVVVDGQGQLIEAVFHANSGGETAAAGDVWLREIPYLRRVPDPHSVGRRGARWTQRIPLESWRSFLESKGVARRAAGGYAYRSSHRASHYRLAGARAVPFRDIREHFRLKSAWFDVRVLGSAVVLEGRGYGHGIGLSQEGAMEMARRGYGARAIVEHYFPGTRVVDRAAVVE